MTKNWDLDTPLIQFQSSSGSSCISIRNAVEGTIIFGGIGSGKTSASARKFALKFLEHGFGGLVLTVKNDEKDNWIDYAKQIKRLNDLIIVEPLKDKARFNFLNYEAAQKPDGLTLTDNIVQVIYTVINAGQEK